MTTHLRGLFSEGGVEFIPLNLIRNLRIIQYYSISLCIAASAEDQSKKWRNN